MSLKERVASVQGATREARGEDLTIIGLRAKVQELLPSEELARLTASNPGRARSEVRRACQKVFSEPQWVNVDEHTRLCLVGELLDSLFGFGPLEGLLADEEVTEIMVNGPNSVFFEKEGRLYPSGQAFASEDQLRALIDRILGPLGRRVDESSPMVNARLPQGHRVNVVMPPLSLVGPVVTIRKFSASVFELDDLMRKGTFGEDVARFLSWAVRARKNIAVSGGTGSGKTTLLNALSCEIDPGERIVTIEDSAELRFLKHPHVVSLEARPENAEGKGLVTIRDLVINALRMRPDRIVVGECRGAEALDMLQAMNTGHDGSLTTLHANAPEEVVSRLTTMVRYCADLPVDVVEANIATALDLIVQTSRAPNGSRFLSEISEISYNPRKRRCECSSLYRRLPHEPAGRWIAEPRWIGELPLLGVAPAEEVERWRHCLCCAA